MIKKRSFLGLSRKYLKHSKYTDFFGVCNFSENYSFTKHKTVPNIEFGTKEGP
jgi:hypothetical protein